MNVVLLRLLVDAGHEEDPPLNTPLWPGLTNLVTVHALVIALKMFDIVEGQTGLIKEYRTHYSKESSRSQKNSKRHIPL